MAYRDTTDPENAVPSRASPQDDRGGSFAKFLYVRVSHISDKKKKKEKAIPAIHRIRRGESYLRYSRHSVISWRDSRYWLEFSRELE